MRVQLRNKQGVIVANETSNSDLKGVLELQNVVPWWPYLMHTDPGYLYQMEVFLHGPDDVLLDVYRLRVGVRTLSWSESTFMINNRPVYFRGFGRHEDSDVCYRDLVKCCIVNRRNEIFLLFILDKRKRLRFGFNDERF